MKKIKKKVKKKKFFFFFLKNIKKKGELFLKKNLKLIILIERSIL
jgi:hypothetical protein